jgi:hypothetical protein
MLGAQTSAVTAAAARSAVGTRRACVGEESASRERGRPASPPKAIPPRKKARRCAKSRDDPPDRKAYARNHRISKESERYPRRARLAQDEGADSPRGLLPRLLVAILAVPQHASEDDSPSTYHKIQGPCDGNGATLAQSFHQELRREDAGEGGP